MASVFSKVKVVAVVVGLIGAWLLGFQSASEKFELKAAQLKLEYEQRSHMMEANYRERERQANDARTVAWEERDRAYARLNESRYKFDRMRRDFAEYRSKVSGVVATAKNDGGIERERDIELLERSSDLLGRCESLLRKESADKNAIVKIYDSAIRK